MTDDEATKLNINPDVRRDFFRLDGAKSNYAKIEEAEWFERVEYKLDNDDGVAAAVPWNPPRDIVDNLRIVSVQADVEAGHNGEPFTFRKGTPRSLINMLQDRHQITTSAGVADVARMLKAAGFVEVEYKEPRSRKPAKGIRAPNGLPSVEWLD